MADIVISSDTWSSMLDVLKDIASYLGKQDAVQERAKIDKPPKIQETQKPIKGGEAPGFGPAKGIAKQYIPVPSEETSVGEDTESSLSGSVEGTLLKEKEDESENLEELEDAEENEEEEKTTLDSEDIEELKSIMKEVKKALVTSSMAQDISKAINDGIKKALPSAVSSETEKMLRKMGFSPSRSDITKFGVDEDIKKSEDMKTEISSEDQAKEVEKFVEKQTKKSFLQLAQEREGLGHFRLFP